MGNSVSPLECEIEVWVIATVHPPINLFRRVRFRIFEGRVFSRNAISAFFSWKVGDAWSKLGQPDEMKFSSPAEAEEFIRNHRDILENTPVE